MPQLHFSVDDETARRIERDAKKRGMTVSKYLASLILRDVGDEWPRGYLEAVVGSCAKTPLKEPPDLPIDDVNLDGR